MQHTIYVKLLRYFIFLFLYQVLKSDVYFKLEAHLNLEKPCFKGSVAICG